MDCQVNNVRIFIPPHHNTIISLNNMSFINGKPLIKLFNEKTNSFVLTLVRLEEGLAFHITSCQWLQRIQKLDKSWNIFFYTIFKNENSYSSQFLGQINETNFVNSQLFTPFVKASEGNASAQFKLGVMHENKNFKLLGKFELLEQNVDKAKYWYKLAADQEHVKAQNKLRFLQSGYKHILRWFVGDHKITLYIKNNHFFYSLNNKTPKLIRYGADNIENFWSLASCIIDIEDDDNVRFREIGNEVFHDWIVNGTSHQLIWLNDDPKKRQECVDLCLCHELDVMEEDERIEKIQRLVDLDILAWRICDVTNMIIKQFSLSELAFFYRGDRIQNDDLRVMDFWRKKTLNKMFLSGKLALCGLPIQKLLDFCAQEGDLLKFVPASMLLTEISLRTMGDYLNSCSIETSDRGLVFQPMYANSYISPDKIIDRDWHAVTLIDSARSRVDNIAGWIAPFGHAQIVIEGLDNAGKYFMELADLYCRQQEGAEVRLVQLLDPENLTFKGRSEETWLRTKDKIDSMIEKINADKREINEGKLKIVFCATGSHAPEEVREENGRTIRIWRGNCCSWARPTLSHADIYLRKEGALIEAPCQYTMRDRRIVLFEQMLLVTNRTAFWSLAIGLMIRHPNLIPRVLEILRERNQSQ